jgi:sugar phosphate isomerase/epimerase
MPTNHEPRATNIRLGISSYTYSWAVGVPGYKPAHPLDENGLLDKARELNVALLQIGDNLPLHDFEPARLDRLTKRAARENVQLEVGARRLTTERLAEYTAIARRVGARLLRFVIDDTDYHPAPAEVTGVLRSAAPLLRGLTLGIENHDRFPAATLRSMIEATGSDNIGVCLDTANSLGAGEGIAAVAAVLAPITVNLHIKDFWIERVPHLMGFTVTGRPAGNGMLELPALLEQLAAHGRCQTAVLETWPPPEANLEATLAKESEWAAQSIQYLKPFFP